MKKIKAIIFDKDDTFMKDQVYSPYIAASLLFDDTLEACKVFDIKGFTLFLLSNQSGVERNYFAESDLIDAAYTFIDKLRLDKIAISRFMYCPHNPEQNCECRKPRIGLFKQLDALYKIDINESYYIGDRLSDILFAQNSGLKGVLIKRNNYAYKYDDLADSVYGNDLTIKLKFNSLIEFAKFI